MVISALHDNVDMTKPHISEIFERIATDIELKLPDAAVRLKESLLSTLAAAMAGAVSSLYDYIERLSRETLPDTATESGLKRWAKLLGVPRLEDELLESWRLRIIKRLQDRAKIGDGDDYQSWAIASHEAIKTAWVRQGKRLGVIDITLIGRDSPILSDDVLAVALAKIQRLQNVGASIAFHVPVIRPVDITIMGVADKHHTAIEQGLANLFALKNKANDRVLEAEIDAVIQRYTLDYTLLKPAQNIQAVDNELLVLGAVQWLV